MDFQLKALQATRQNILNAIEELSLEQLNEVHNGFNNSIIWNVAHVLVTQQLLVYKLSNLDITIPGDLIDKYKKGSKAIGDVTEKEVDEIKALLISTIKITQQDYKNGIFKEFDEYPTSYNIILNSTEEAIIFNNIHEGLHLGYIMAMKKMVL